MITQIIVNDFNGIKDGDSIVMFNYRSDRVRQITKAFVGKSFRKFKRKKIDLVYVCMARYYKGVPAFVVLESKELKSVLGEILSKHNVNQLIISKTDNN